MSKTTRCWAIAAAVAAACAVGAAEKDALDGIWRAELSKDELVRDWLEQDSGLAPGVPFEKGGVEARIAKALSRHGIAKDAGGTWADALARYRASCAKRRAVRLKPLEGTRWVYCRHYVMGGSHYAYTEAVSDAHNERTFLKIGSSLCMAEYSPGGLWKETELLATKDGCFRDADVSPDGKRILYSFKESDLGDDFHLYEMDLATRKTRRLTEGKGVADYEGCYLPDGRILFNSTRCMQIVDCWWTEVSNLYRCDADGSNIVRMTYDQVHDNYPSLTWDGRILYTRWEYNDRSQIHTQPLFSMNVDGTNQRAFYGGNSWFPTTLIHARAVPGSPLFFGICTGHHSFQPGELMRFDPREGREEAEGAWQLEPLRRAEARKIDVDGQQGRIAAYPYPLDENSVVLSFLPRGWRRDRVGALPPGWRKLPEGWPQYRDHLAPFALYWTDVNGARELLVAQTGKVPCGRPVQVRVRSLPNRPSAVADESARTGVVAVRDVYVGDSMKGVKRGTVKSMRVVALEYRPVGIGHNGNKGPGGMALSCSPPSIGNGSWSVKRVLGEAPVAEDGSVAVEVPARVPVYFMLLDKDGRMVQSMRSWTTLQPGETAGCVGCHEPPNQAPDFRNAGMDAGRSLASLGRPSRGFSFPKDVQPILDCRCVGCHNPAKNAKLPDLTGAPVRDACAKRKWSKAYVSLLRPRASRNQWMIGALSADPDAKNGYVDWIGAASVPTPLPPLANGSRVSRLFTERLDKGHCKDITEAEKRVIACWIDLGVPFCGDYSEANAWNKTDLERWNYFTRKRKCFATPGEPQ